jgi:uncharacterized protein
MIREGLTSTALVLLVSLAVFQTAAGQEQFPRPTGYVSDFAGVISRDAEVAITRMAQEVKAKTGAEIAVATIETTGGRDIEEYSVDLYMSWGIGERGKDNGVLILAAMADRKLWIKTGYGLEGAIPDAVAHVIYREVLRPGFRSAQHDEALVTATRMLAERILAETGETLAYSDSVPGAFALRPAARRPISPWIGLVAVLFPIAFVILLRMAAGRSGYGRRYGGFWVGGVGGSSGGFGGGFGGFGGGACGGGGAGGGW